MIKEKDFYNFKYRYEGVDISTYENAKKGDEILFCGIKRNVIYRTDSNSNELMISVYILSMNNGSIKHNLYLKDLIYCYYNNIIKILKNTQVLYIDDNKNNLNISNLRLVYSSIPENLIHDNDFRFKYTDIKDYENSKMGDSIIFGGKPFIVGSDKLPLDHPLLKIMVISDSKKSSQYKLYLKDLIYCYYNDISIIPKDKKIINIDGDKFNLNVNNLRLVDKVISEKDFYDWNYRFKHIDNIEIYENVEIGTRIPFGDKYYTTIYTNLKDKRLAISPTVNIDGVSKIMNLPLHRLIYEYGHKIILTENDEIHHMDHDKHNNKLYNLQRLTPSEHTRLHNSKQIINLNTMEIFDSIIDASNFYNIQYSSISHCCLKNIKTAGGYKWMYLTDYIYDKFIEEYIFVKHDLKMNHFGIEDLEKSNPYKGFEEFTDFKDLI